MTEASPARANMGFIGAIVAVATIGGFLFGYDSGAVNGTQPGLTAAFGLIPGSFSPGNGLAFTVASLLIGCFIGAFFAGRLADIAGRRNVMRLAAVLFLVGALVQGIAHNHLIFVLARILGGMAVGAASVLSPAYISEVAPASIRGRMTTVQQIMIITGLTAAFVVNYFLAASAGVSTAPFWGGLEAWRWMYLIQSLPAAIFLVALFFIPESPRYLVSKGRLDNARTVLAQLFGGEVADAQARRDSRYVQRRSPAAAQRRARTGGHAGLRRHPPDRLGGHHAGGVPAARRHQRHLLLRRDLVAARRLQRERFAADQHRLRRRLDRRLLRHHRCYRQDRPQAAAADRLCGHGGDLVRHGLRVQPRRRSIRRATSCSPATSAWSPWSPPTST